MNRKKRLRAPPEKKLGKAIWTWKPKGRWEKFRYFLPLFEAFLDEFTTAA
jgi:hypothetical protein